MTDTIKKLWDSLSEQVEKYKKVDKNITFKDDAYSAFEKNFFDIYNKIKDEHMKPSVKNLDRHKVAATTIVSALKADIISYNQELKNKLFLGCEMFITEVALTWMLDSLNKKLEELNIHKLQQYYMPEAFTCKTPYFEIFCRNLFITKKDYQLNPLNISETLFLLEYISLLKNNIDPLVLKR